MADISQIALPNGSTYDIRDTSKQETLVSGTNIKTINNQSLLGSGNISISGGGSTNIQILTQDKSFTSSSERVSLSSGTSSKTVLSVTAPFAGYAIIAGNVTMTTNSSGNRNVSVSVAGTTIDQDTRAAHSTNNGNLGIAAVASVSSGDVVALQVWQSSGSTLYGGGHLGVMFIEA